MQLIRGVPALGPQTQAAWPPPRPRVGWRMASATPRDETPMQTSAPKPPMALQGPVGTHMCPLQLCPHLDGSPTSPTGTQQMRKAEPPELLCVPISSQCHLHGVGVGARQGQGLPRPSEPCGAHRGAQSPCPPRCTAPCCAHSHLAPGDVQHHTSLGAGDSERPCMSLSRGLCSCLGPALHWGFGAQRRGVQGHRDQQ